MASAGWSWPLPDTGCVILASRGAARAEWNALPAALAAAGAQVIYRSDRELAANAQTALAAASALCDRRVVDAVRTEREVPCIALHQGAADAIGHSLAGRDLLLARSIAAAGHGGQVLLSAAVAAQLAGSKDATLQVESLGVYRLRHLGRPEALFQLVAPGGRVSFPPLDSLDRHRHNLPMVGTPFVGRESEIRSLVGLLADPANRLLTLTGAGGSGKTRLALHAAAGAVATFEDGAFFVPLAGVEAPELIAASIASALNAHAAPGEDQESSVTRHLGKKRLLLILDNFERLLGAAPLLPRLIGECEHVTILTTSRERLNLTEERELHVPPLEVPAQPAAPAAAGAGLTGVASASSVQLFVDRARAVEPAFRLSPNNAPLVAELCRRLDGLPLAVELAAARLRMLTPQEMLARLDL